MPHETTPPFDPEFAAAQESYLRTLREHYESAQAQAERDAATATASRELAARLKFALEHAERVAALVRGEEFVEPVRGASGRLGSMSTGSARSGILDALRFSGQPMRVVEIYDWLQGRGVEIRKTTLNVELIRMKKIGLLVRVSTGVYALPPAA